MTKKVKRYDRREHVVRHMCKKFLFLFCTFNTLSITCKRVSKRSSIRYRFQEHLLKFLMLLATHSE
jgi:hypothetical protein